MISVWPPDRWTCHNIVNLCKIWSVSSHLTDEHAITLWVCVRYDQCLATWQVNHTITLWVCKIWSGSGHLTDEHATTLWVCVRYDQCLATWQMSHAKFLNPFVPGRHHCLCSMHVIIVSLFCTVGCNCWRVLIHSAFSDIGLISRSRWQLKIDFISQFWSASTYLLVCIWGVSLLWFRTL